MMDKFLLRIKCIIDGLGLCGDHVLSHEHLDLVLESLLQEYGPMISVIESKFEPLLIGEVDALLLAHEACMKKIHKCFADSPLINVAQGYNSSLNSYKFSLSNFNSQN